MSDGPNAGAILLAIFLILFGLCLTLLGGGCAVFWIWAMLQGGSMNGSGGFLMVGLVTFAIGVVLLWASVKLLSGNKGTGPTPPPPSESVEP
jgi:hypothetical protein